MIDKMVLEFSEHKNQSLFELGIDQYGIDQ